jgi:hypothetical protein
MDCIEEVVRCVSSPAMQRDEWEKWVSTPSPFDDARLAATLYEGGKGAGDATVSSCEVQRQDG